MMKKILMTTTIALALALIAPVHAEAQQIRQAGKFGIGIGSGTLASGLSLKYFTSNDFAIQGNIGYLRYGWGGCPGWAYDRGRYCRAWGRGGLGLGADALWEMPTLAGNQDVTLDWYVGAGLGLGISEFSGFLSFALAGVGGLAVNIHAIPIDIALELRPSILLFDGGRFAFDLINFTGHIRYYF